MADNTDTDILVEAFDVLAAKSLSIEPSASLVDWVRRKYFNKRGEFAHIVGLFANLDKIAPEQIAESFVTFDAFVRDSNLIHILLDTRHPVVLKLLLERYSDLVELGDKLNLLRHPSKEVRIQAIRSIETNQIGALKIIIDHYNREKDLEVREVYKEEIPWVREREGGR